MRSLVDKIEIVLDPEIDALYKAAQEMDLRMHSRVEITTKDGRQFDSGVVERGADRYTERGSGAEVPLADRPRAPRGEDRAARPRAAPVR